MTPVPALPGLARDVPDLVTVGDVVLSGERLVSAAAAVARRIAGAPTVAVAATPSATTVVAVLGALLAGVPAAPLPADAAPAERDHLLREAGAALVLAADGDDVPASPLPLVPVDVSDSADAAGLPGPPEVALVLGTSGTTGAPKGVELPWAAVLHDLDALAEAWAWTADDVLVHGLPLFHVHGLVLGVLGALRTGSRLVHTVRPTPDRYAAAGGSLFFGVPTVWSRVAADPAAARALRPARLLVSGSAALPAPVARDLAGLCGHVPVERYGMTETLITVAARADTEPVVGTVGRPLRGVEARVVDDDGTPTPVDGQTPGDLQVRGATLFAGYRGRPEATAAAYTDDGWFRTGDLAVLRPDGLLRIVGRRSADLIKSGGYRIGAGEVEDALLGHPAVREAAVVGMPDDDLGQVVVAFVVGDADVADVAAHADRTLARHKRPRRIHLVPALPRNAMGKVQKSRLVE